MSPRSESSSSSLHYAFAAEGHSRRGPCPILPHSTQTGGPLEGNDLHDESENSEGRWKVFDACFDGVVEPDDSSDSLPDDFEVGWDMEDVAREDGLLVDGRQPSFL